MRTRTVAVLALAGALGSTGAPAVAARPTASPIDLLLARTTLPQKVGQLFTAYAYGADANAPAAADAATNRRLYGVDTPAQVVAKYHLGGVIHFAWTNGLQNPRQIATLNNGLQAASAIPLLVSTDQEQGVVSRLPAPATQFPGAMALGAGRNVLDAYTAGRGVGPGDGRSRWTPAGAGAGSGGHGTPGRGGRGARSVRHRPPAGRFHLPHQYSFTSVAMESLAKVLLGVTAPRGKLPVSIPVAGDPATVLYPYGHDLTWRIP